MLLSASKQNGFSEAHHAMEPNNPTNKIQNKHLNYKIRYKINTLYLLLKFVHGYVGASSMNTHYIRCARPDDTKKT